METKVLYLRIPADLHTYLKDQADQTGISLNSVATALLAHCKQSNLAVKPASVAPITVS